MTRAQPAERPPRAQTAASASGPPLALVGFVVFSVALVGFMRVPLLPDIGRDLRLSTGQLGLITAAFAVGRLLMDLPAGRIADRLPPVVTLSGAGAGIAVSAALLATAQSLAQALVATAVIGFVSAQTNTTGMKEFATQGPEERRGRSMAWFANFLMTGQTLGPALAGALAGLAGWRVAQASGAIAGVVVAVTCVVVVRRRRAVSRERPPEAPAPALVGRQLSRRDLLVLAAVPFAVFFTMGGVIQTLIPLIGAGELELGPTAIGLAIGLGSVSRAIGAVAAGQVSDAVSRKAALVPSLLVMVAGVLLLVPPPTLVTWGLALVLIALGTSGMPVAATMIADRVPAGTLGRQFGSYRFIGDLGLLAGPLLAALAAEQAGREAAMGLTAAVVLAAVAGLFFIRSAPAACA